MTVGTYDVCAIPIAALTPEAAAEEIVARARTGSSCEVHLCNAYTLSLVRQNDELREALSRGDLNLPDGTPVAWLGRRSGVLAPVRGPGLVADVMRAGSSAGVTHYLCGGSGGIADAMRVRLEGSVPGVRIVGVEEPPFGELTESYVDGLAERVSACGAQIVWIGLGTPKQDHLVPRLADRFGGVVIPVGAAFDFIGGRVREAPSVLRGTGTEWLYRLAREPRRLWRRYLIGNPRFVVNVVRSKVSAIGRPVQSSNGGDT